MKVNNIQKPDVWSYGFLIHTVSMMLAVWTIMPEGISPPS